MDKPLVEPLGLRHLLGSVVCFIVDLIEPVTVVEKRLVIGEHVLTRLRTMDIS